MKKIRMTLTAKEPLIITNGTTEGMAHRTLSHIPGRILLGAFASLWISLHRGQNPDATREFQDLFLNGKVSWGCANPLCLDQPTVPVPLCYMREKSMAGLPVEGYPINPDQCGVYNVLPLAKEEKLSEVWKSKHGSEQPPKFKKLAAGFMQPRTFRQPDLRNVWNMRVALGEQRSALEGQLFGFAAIAQGTRFGAEIVFEPSVEAALLELLNQRQQIRLGHSRSSGYGQTAITIAAPDKDAAPTVTAQIFNIFLLAPYLADPAWENPLHNLVAKISALCGQQLEPIKSYAVYEQMEAYNMHWGQWRQSRMALASGSVIQLQAKEPLQLPQMLALGALQQEGNGRICVNPDFLADVELTIPAEMPAQPTKQSTPLPTGWAWRIMRQRACERAAAAQAEVWLHERKWLDFIESVAKLNHPTASQRANVMKMDKAQFETMLGKTPGEQWRTAPCSNPFGNGNEFLSEVMKNILDKQAFLQKMRDSAVVSLPDETAAEKETIQDMAWKKFKRDLVRAWSKQKRIGDKEGDK